MLSQNLTLERNAVAILLILLGIFNLIVGIYGIKTWLEYLHLYSAITGQTINYSILFNNFHLLVIIGVLLISSGLLLILKRKSGWVISTALIADNCLLFPSALSKLINDPEKVNFDSNTQYLLITLYSVLALLSFLSFVIMILPRFRTQFNTGPKQYWIALALFVILQLDRILF